MQTEKKTMANRTDYPEIFPDAFDACFATIKVIGTRSSVETKIHQSRSWIYGFCSPKPDLEASG
jgi:hypothetical protein